MKACLTEQARMEQEMQRMILEHKRELDQRLINCGLNQMCIDQVIHSQMNLTWDEAKEILIMGGEFTDASDASIIILGKNLDGSDATWLDYSFAGVGLLIPVVSGSAVKNGGKFIIDETRQAIVRLGDSGGKGRVNAIWILIAFFSLQIIVLTLLFPVNAPEALENYWKFLMYSNAFILLGLIICRLYYRKK